MQDGSLGLFCVHKSPLRRFWGHFKDHLLSLVLWFLLWSYGFPVKLADGTLLAQGRNFGRRTELTKITWCDCQLEINCTALILWFHVLDNAPTSAPVKLWGGEGRGVGWGEFVAYLGLHKLKWALLCQGGGHRNSMALGENACLRRWRDSGLQFTDKLLGSDPASANNRNCKLWMHWILWSPTAVHQISAFMGTAPHRLLPEQGLASTLSQDRLFSRIHQKTRFRFDGDLLALRLACLKGKHCWRMSEEPLSLSLPVCLLALAEGGRAWGSIFCCTEQSSSLYSAALRKRGEKWQEND